MQRRPRKTSRVSSRPPSPSPWKGRSADLRTDRRKGSGGDVRLRPRPVPRKSQPKSGPSVPALAKTAKQSPLGLPLLALRQLVEDVGGLVHPAALLADLGPHLAERLPEAERAIGDGQLRRDR